MYLNSMFYVYINGELIKTDQDIRILPTDSDQETSMININARALADDSKAFRIWTQNMPIKEIRTFPDNLAIDMTAPLKRD